MIALTSDEITPRIAAQILKETDRNVLKRIQRGELSSRKEVKAGGKVYHFLQRSEVEAFARRREHEG